MMSGRMYVQPFKVFQKSSHSVSFSRASKENILPLSHPVRGTDGREFTELIIPRGMLVLTHYQASNVNEELWGEDAKEWKPERWLSPLPTALEDARIPGVYAHL